MAGVLNQETPAVRALTPRAHFFPLAYLAAISRFKLFEILATAI
jgi:hypothetical protein